MNVFQSITDRMLEEVRPFTLKGVRQFPKLSHLHQLSYRGMRYLINADQLLQASDLLRLKGV